MNLIFSLVIAYVAIVFLIAGFAIIQDRSGRNTSECLFLWIVLSILSLFFPPLLLLCFVGKVR